MQLLDKIFALGALAGLFVFCYILMEFVHEPDLWVVTCLVLSIAAYFFVRELRAGGSHFARQEEQNKE